VLKPLSFLVICGFSSVMLGQQPSPSSQPPVKVNVLNVCSPSAEDQKEIAATLAKISRQPLFSADFEVSRGRSTLSERPDFLQAGESAQFSTETATADWVRIRREFSVQAFFSSVQYSFSRDSKNMVEVLVFRVRDPKDVMQVSVEDSAASVTSPAAMLGTNTPASRIKLERFGRSSIVLARCSAAPDRPAPDQSAYEPVFSAASSVMSAYREALGARRTVPAELVRVTEGVAPKSKAVAHPMKKKTGN
jgi:hypothetical protein